MTCSGYGVRDYSKAQRAKCVEQTKTGISTFRESSEHRNNQDRSFNPLRIKDSVLGDLMAADSPRGWGGRARTWGKGSRIKDEATVGPRAFLTYSRESAIYDQLATPQSARQGRVKAIDPTNDSALERVSSESIESARALGLSGASP